MALTQARHSILLVDDEQAFLQSLGDVLETIAPTLSPMLAYEGSEALELLAAHPVDLLVTDIKMPGLDGLELLRLVRERYPELPTMVMTSIGTPELETQAYRLGVRAYFEKPLDLEEFVRVIRRALGCRDEPEVV